MLLLKKTPQKIINQAFYFAIAVAFLNLALPLGLWLFKILPLMPQMVFIRELVLSIITVILAVLMKYKKHLLSSVLLFSLACFQLVLILINLILFYDTWIKHMNLLSLSYIGLGILIVLLSLFFYYRAMLAIKRNY
jgi:hypothetical protein